MKSKFSRDNPSPKGGMEVGLLSIAVLLVLYFVATGIMEEEKGVIVHEYNVWFAPGYEGEGTNLSEVWLKHNNKISFNDKEYSETEFKEFVSSLKVDGTTVYLLNSERSTEFGFVIRIYDSFLEHGFTRNFVFIGYSYQEGYVD